MNFLYNLTFPWISCTIFVESVEELFVRSGLVWVTQYIYFLTFFCRKQISFDILRVLCCTDIILYTIHYILNTSHVHICHTLQTSSAWNFCTILVFSVNFLYNLWISITLLDFCALLIFPWIVCTICRIEWCVGSGDKRGWYWDPSCVALLRMGWVLGWVIQCGRWRGDRYDDYNVCWLNSQSVTCRGHIC